MRALAAPTLLRVAPDQLARQARERFGGELRRAGGFAQLCMLGASACLDAAPRAASIGVLWASAYGARSAAQAALAEAASGEPVMPFTFVATQPHLAATLLTQRGAPVTRAAFVHVAPPEWPMLLDLARGWLATCEAVLLGWVEESVAGEPHQSDWCLLLGEPPASGHYFSLTTVPSSVTPTMMVPAPQTYSRWLAEFSPR